MTAPALSNRRAILSALMAYAVWTGNDALIKTAGQAGFQPFAILAGMGASGVIVSLLLAYSTGTLASFRQARWRKLVLPAATSTLVILANAIALKRISLTVFFIIIMTIPLVTAFLSRLFLQDRRSKVAAGATIIGFIGAIIAIDPVTAKLQAEWLGYAAAFMTVVIFAAYTVYMRLVSQTESSEKTVFAICVFCALTGFIGVIFDSQPFISQGCLAATASGFTFATGYFFYNLALRDTSAVNVSTLQYTQLVMGAVTGFGLWREIPTVHMVAGAAAIVASGLLIAREAYVLDQAKTDNR